MKSVSSLKTWPLSLQYFFYFGVMGIYLPFFNLYCYHLDFTGFQIGLLSGARTLTMVLFSLVWGLVADRFLIRKPLYIACNVISALICVGYLYYVDFNSLLVITIAYAIFYGPIIAFLEAFTIEALGRNADKRSYGRIRVWGSLNFIFVVLILGWVIDVLPIRMVVVLILAGSLAQAMFSPAVSTARGEFQPGSFFIRLKHFLNTRTAVFLICSFLMLASHGTYYTFFSIHLEQLGYSRTFISFAWALASIAEVIVMFKSDIIFKRYTLRQVILFSFLMGTLRWLLLFFNVSSPVIIISQLMHAFTYGAFHIACILYMDELSSEETKTFGQVANNAVSYGLGMMTGFVVNGYFFETYGSYLYLASAGLALAGGCLFACSKGR